VSSQLIARRSLVALAAAVFLVSGAQARTVAKTAHEPLEVVTDHGRAHFQVELADDTAERERGLMFRKTLAPDRGMLFDFKTPREVAFWMRNTLIPLDIIFITKNMTIAGIVENAEPRTETLREVDAPSLYVLEVNGGYCAAHKVTKGAKVRFEGVSPH